MDRIPQEVLDAVQDLHLPRYADLPDMGLYLEQVVRYVNRYIPNPVTSSMVSNYVKQKIIPGPIKKTYGAESIAYLIFVGYIKTVARLEDIRLLMGIQKNSYELPRAYNYFCDETENLVAYVFGVKSEPDQVGQDDTPQKDLLRSALLSITYKIYLDWQIGQYHNKTPLSE